MTTRIGVLGVPALRWALAVVLGAQAATLAVTTLRSAHVHPLLVAIAVAELCACLLLVVPRTRRAGALLLSGVLLAAAVLHVLARETPPAAFIIYLPAIFVVASNRGPNG
jgi:hypothetical protein